MDIKREDILHLAELSNFSLPETEITSLEKDLGEILKYISQLDELDTDGVEPTYQAFDMKNVWRDDEIMAQDAERAELLSLPKNVLENQVKVPKVL